MEIKFTTYEKVLLEKAIAYGKEGAVKGENWLTHELLRRHLRCAASTVAKIHRHILKNKLVELPKKVQLPPGALNEYERSLLDKAVEGAKVLTAAGQMPTVEELRRRLNCGRDAAHRLFQYIQANKLVPAWRDPKSQEVNQVQGDQWTISLPKTRIHTLEELIEYFKVDLTVWEVERFIANKWEMGYKDDKAQAPGSYELYQVKAYLRRRRHATTEGYVKENARLRSQVEKLRFDVRSERELVKRLAVNHAGYDDLLANFKELMQTFGDFSLPRTHVQREEPLVVPATRAGHAEDAVLLLSDHHHGDVIRREDTSGFPEFNLTIGGNRLGYVMKKAKQIFTLHRAMYPLKKLYVWFGGDIGNGILYDSPNSNALFQPAQVHFGYHMLKFAIEDLLTLTVPDANGHVVVEQLALLFSVGNHMRIDEKLPYKYQAQRTLDWLIYRFLIDRFKSHPKVSITEVMSPYIFEQICGHRYLFSHGLQIGYRNSPDLQCKSMDQFIDKVRALFDSPEWRQRNDFTGATFEHICIGDIHVPVEFPRLTSNGSLNGQNELGVNWVLEPIPAGQKIFGVSRSHEQTWNYFLNCSKIQQTPKDMNPYGEFAAEYMRRFGRGGEQ